MSRNTKITFLTALTLIAIFMIVNLFKNKHSNNVERYVKVGFIYEGDDSTPYTANFIRAQRTLESTLEDKIVVEIRANVSEKDVESALLDLIDEHCDIIFTNSFEFGQHTKKIAMEHPNIEFCQATCLNANEEPILKNYHTFMGEIYQGRFVSGVVAGMKLRELIQNGTIKAEQAKIGYVGAYPVPEVISGYTAFLLGIRSIVPSATMEVSYTHTWSNFVIEKKCAEKLIERGCIIISQHSDTIGPAVATEENYPNKTVFHIGYNQSMIDIAPLTSLISTRIDWSPYIIGAVKAVIAKKPIERGIRGNTHGNDIGAGFERGWVQMLELNSTIAAKGTSQKIEQTIEAFKKHEQSVFVGNYVGINPNDRSEVYDLRNEYKENTQTSAPSFNYIIEDIIKIIE